MVGTPRGAKTPYTVLRYDRRLPFGVLSELDWTQELSFPDALANVRDDILDDWYQDPWDWPEYDFVRSEKWKSVVRRANASGVCRPYPVDIPKENFGIRPAIVMEPLDRLLYQALVDKQSKQLINDLDSWVFGWRLPRNERKKPESPGYSNNGVEWTRYRASISAFAGLSNGGLKTDIVSCFAKIPIVGVVDDIERNATGVAVTDRLIDMLVAFDKTPGRPGLQQRSKASAALANMYLKRLDLVLRRYDESVPRSKRFRIFLGRGGVARWMDDIWVFGTDDATLRAVQLELQNAAREASLELNMGKTVVKHGDDLEEAILKIQHSAIDDALRGASPSYGPLEELLDTIIADPENADRTAIRFALRRIRAHKVRSRRKELIDVAPRMPHGADHVARAFRDLGWWRRLQDWYLDYKSGPWGTVEWSVARLGAMFPTRGRGTSKLRQFFAETIAANPTLPLLSVASQRLASWDPRTAIDVIRAKVDTVEHPHERRVLALALVAAGDDRRVIRRILADFEENALTMRAIERNQFRPFPFSPDFGGNESTEEID